MKNRIHNRYIKEQNPIIKNDFHTQFKQLRNDIIDNKFDLTRNFTIMIIFQKITKTFIKKTLDGNK